MKSPIFLGLLASVTFLQAEAPKPKTTATKTYFQKQKVAVHTAAANPGSTETFVYDQKPLQGSPVLVGREQAHGIIEQFKAAYAKLGNPKIAIYVNRDLVDSKTGMKLIARTEKTEETERKIDSTIDGTNRGAAGQVTINSGGNVTVNGSDLDYPGKGTLSSNTKNVSNENRYRIEERQQTLADRQTVRDVERLFGRPLRTAGAALADQSVATQLIASREIKSFVINTEGEQATKDREALKKIADVVIEVLISSRNLTVAEVSGDKIYSAPDIQATAIRLSDSQIVGQASATDVIGKDRYAGRIVRNFDVREIAEATALALMEDMASSVE